MKNPIIENKKTVIFEDDKIEVRGIKDILKGISEITVVGVFDTMHEALSNCKEIKPDLIIADADIRGDKTIGPLFVQNVLKILPNVKVLGLTRWPDCIVRLKQAGCKEVVLKQFFDNEEAARKFIKETLLDPPVFYIDDEPPVLKVDEDKVLRMVANGKTEIEIEEKLEKTRKQVRNIKDDLKDIFGVDSGKDAQLVAHAYRMRYFKADEDLSEY